MDSNKKLADYQAILHTQQVQDLKRIEEENRAKWRAAKAKKVSKNAEQLAVLSYLLNFLFIYKRIDGVNSLILRGSCKVGVFDRVQQTTN